MAATEVALASFEAARILRAGGNAVDASIAASLVLAVTVPHLGGVGGDFFILYMDPNGRVHFINGSGQAPARLNREELASRGLNSIPERGPLSTVVPGMLGGLYEAWRRFGSLEWKELVEPARKLAARGFPLPASTARALRNLEQCLSSDPGSRSSILKKLPREPGAPAKMPGLAALMALYAEDPYTMYKGEVAEAIDDYIYSVGGVLSLDDLKRYSPLEAEPLRGEYKGYVIYEMPPNSQGATTFYVLYGLEERPEHHPPFSKQRAEVLAEAAMTAYRIRDAVIGDPTKVPVGADELASREFYLKMKERGPRLEAGAGKGDTTFFAVADGEGGVAAAIQSLFYPFGSCVTEPRFQVTLNNRALGFTLAEGLPSSLEPGARPLHTLSAVIIEGDGRIVALGASGGHLRPQQHALFITNMIDYGMNVDEAINAPRAVLDPSSRVILYEEGWEPGPGWRKAERIGVANAVEVIEGGVKRGYTDKRGEGVPVPV